MFPAHLIVASRARLTLKILCQASAWSMKMLKNYTFYLVLIYISHCYRLIAIESFFLKKLLMPKVSSFASVVLVFSPTCLLVHLPHLFWCFPHVVNQRFLLYVMWLISSSEVELKLVDVLQPLACEPWM